MDFDERAPSFLSAVEKLPDSARLARCLDGTGRREGHEQRIGSEEVCLAVTVNRGGLVPLTMLGRILKLVANV